MTIKQETIPLPRKLIDMRTRHYDSASRVKEMSSTVPTYSSNKYASLHTENIEIVIAVVGRDRSVLFNDAVNDKIL